MIRPRSPSTPPVSCSGSFATPRGNRASCLHTPRTWRADTWHTAAGRSTMMRFAFKGRCSTEDQQDPAASRAWQLTRAKALVEPHGGVIVAEYFDIGQSRSVPWRRRPEAAALLAELKNPSRGFEAVV